MSTFGNLSPRTSGTGVGGAPTAVRLETYDLGRSCDELIGVDRRARPAAAAVLAHLSTMSFDELVARQELAIREIETAGISFTVYDDGAGIDRAWPFDVVPRILSLREWRQIERGLTQRLAALNHFIDDVYGDQRIIDAGVVDRELVMRSPNYRPACVGVIPPHATWAHVCGSDLVRDRDGTMYVLEDNLRVPSGVSYLLENRLITKRVFGDLFADQSVLPVDGYPEQLFRTLADLSPRRGDHPVIALLTPGIFNAAYFEHSFLARAMGVHLVEGRDLVVDNDDNVRMRTVEGELRVDVIYRRIDDVFLDPEAFLSDSQLGVPGLMRAWRSGRVAIANSPGSGIADDKSIYPYVPDMIRFYLDEEPLLPNVPTHRCVDPAEQQHVLANLDQLVVKPANESGGKGIVVGPVATPAELGAVADAITADPWGWVAQPVIELSTVPTLADDASLVPRHVDLRPFVLQARQSFVSCGGLTRVARDEGSLIVNSSQGGGSKDTWIVDVDSDLAAGAFRLGPVDEAVA